MKFEFDRGIKVVDIESFSGTAKFSQRAERRGVSQSSGLKGQL
jgi:hypothetical protein